MQIPMERRISAIDHDRGERMVLPPTTQAEEPMLYTHADADT